MDALIRSLQSAADPLLALLPRLLLAALTLVITLVVTRRMRRVLQPWMARVRMPATAGGLIVGSLNLTVIVFGLLVTLQLLGLGDLVYSALASLGIVGLILSFALQDITKQFASGVLLLLSNPFTVGDRIKVGDHEGEVLELQLRVTVLKTDAGDRVLIPNADVYTSALVVRGERSY